MSVLKVGEVDIQITYNGEVVEYMFDIEGSETFDLSEVYEVTAAGELHEVQPGDELLIEYI